MNTSDNSSVTSETSRPDWSDEIYEGGLDQAASATLAVWGAYAPSPLKTEREFREREQLQQSIEYLLLHVREEMLTCSSLESAIEVLTDTFILDESLVDIMTYDVNVRRVVAIIDAATASTIRNQGDGVE